MKTSLSCNIAFLAALLFAVAASASTTALQATTKNRPSFEAASIRPGRSGMVPGPRGANHDRFTATGVSLKALVGYAYRVAPWQVEGGPGWVNSQPWNIEAKADEKIISAAPKPRDPLAPDVIALMLQSLLEDRFKLRIEHQTKESRVYNLIVAKGGSKIKLDEDKKSPPTHLYPEGLKQIDEVLRGGCTMTLGFVQCRAIPIAGFINMCLLSHTDRPIIDRSNLKGLYNFKMRWSPENPASGSSTGLPSPLTRMDRGFGPAFFTAMKEQLGLELKSAKDPVEFIVITSAEKPSEN
jgi:uncharacterized protein (TIGR03435 family)